MQTWFAQQFIAPARTSTPNSPSRRAQAGGDARANTTKATVTAGRVTWRIARVLAIFICIAGLSAEGAPKMANTLVRSTVPALAFSIAVGDVVRSSAPNIGVLARPVQAALRLLQAGARLATALSVKRNFHDGRSSITGHIGIRG